MKISNRELLNSIIPMLLIDVFLMTVASAIAYIICVDFRSELVGFKSLLFFVMTCTPIFIFVFFASGVYRNIWNDLHTGGILRISFACILVISTTIIVHALFLRGYIFPVYFYFVFLFFLLIFTMGIRIAPKALDTIFKFLRRGRNQEGEPTLIVGAGRATTMFLEEIERSDFKKYKIVGLVDDDQKKQRLRLRGAKVLGKISSIPHIVEKEGVQNIIVAIPSAGKETINRILKICPDNLDIKVMPHVGELSDPAALKNIREISIDDLLGRQQLNIDTPGIYSMLCDKVVMVTGGGGSIGSELCRQIIKYSPKKLIILDFYENNAYEIQQEMFLGENQRVKDVLDVCICNIQEMDRLDDAMNLYRPDVIFHAAAYKHVPLMEAYPYQAVKNNIIGTYNLVKCSLKYKVKKFVMISTDKAVRPTNVMGATKRAAELIVQAFNSYKKTEFVSVRFGNVLGSNGSVVPLFKKQILNGGPVTITDPRITRFFMTIPEAANLVLGAFSMAKGGEVFILDMGEPIKIIDLAHNMIKLSGFRPGIDIEIKYTGLRPGEKLYEELMLEGEAVYSSPNEKIFVSKTREYSIEMVEEAVLNFKRAIVEKGDILKFLKDFVPSYSCQIGNEIESLEDVEDMVKIK